MTEFINYIEDQPSITHLHVHTEYSLADGAIKVKDLINKAKEFGHKAVAITDHVNLSSAIEFYLSAREAGIKPIIGSEIFHKPFSNLHEFNDSSIFKMVLLSRNKNGYKNLVKIVSASYEDNVKVPACSIDVVSKYCEDQIAILSCHGSEFSFFIHKLRKLFGNDRLSFAHNNNETIDALIKELDEYVKKLKSFFKEGNVFVELTNNNILDQKQHLSDLSSAALHFNLPLVATANAHYLNEDDVDAHAILISIKNDFKVGDIRNRKKNAKFHLFSNEEFLEYYKDWPSAVDNTAIIAERCNVDFEFGNYYLPNFEIQTGESSEEALTRLAREGLEERFQVLSKQYGAWFNEEKQKEYHERLNYELGVIIKMGFPGYFLIVQDFINWAKSQGIPVGPGRGSGAGSLVAYALRITNLDPIYHKLIFERFLNPERVSMPDFDVDFCQDRRDEVIEYVTRKYGERNVAQITTFGKMNAKAVVRDVGRVLNISYTKVDKIAKLIPDELGIKLADALEREPKLKEATKENPLIEDLLKYALKLEGLNRHTSVHAAGIVISDKSMDEYVPVYRSEDGSLITQFEMKNAEKSGLVKFDFLGLKTLTVINHTINLVHKTLNPDFDIDTIDLEERRVYDLISTGNTVGIFQLESSGMQKLILKLHPNKFDELVALVALFRPGPLQSGMVDDFVERKHGRQPIEYLLPQLEPIIKDTYGIILYQEQVQKIAASLANYSLGEADLLRRAMGKKKPMEMAKQRTRFIAGAEKNNIPKEIATNIFDIMAKFAEYGFNKSHSAAYGLISYQTAFLKTYYPEQFMAAIMSSDLDNTDKIIRYVKECRRMGFRVNPPDINKSELEFNVPQPKQIGFGLAAIKGIGESSVKPLIDDVKVNGYYNDLSDLAKRVDLHKIGKKTLEILTEAGALDSLNNNRRQTFSIIENLVKASENYHYNKSIGQGLLFEDQELSLESIFNNKNTKITKKAIELHQANADLNREKELLGVYLSAHPLDLFDEDIKKFSKVKLSDIEKYAGKSEFQTVVMLNDVFETRTKKDKKILVFRFEDQTDSLQVSLFENDWPEEIPKTGEPMVCNFKVLQNKGFSSSMVKLESFSSLENFRKEKVMGLGINLSITDTKDKLNKLKDVIDNFRGKTPLRFNVEINKVKIKLASSNNKVDLSDNFIQNIKDIGIGKDSFQYYI